MTRAWWLWNDHCQARFPIQKALVTLLVKNVPRLFSSAQPYLTTLYQALLLTTYFGLFRIGELTFSKHVLKAKDVHIGTNKDKLLFVLHTSKTHNKGSKPQSIKICAEGESNRNPWCPFVWVQKFLSIRKKYVSDGEQFYVFHDCSPVTPSHYLAALKKLLQISNINSKFYSVHIICAGRTKDLFDMGVSVETIKKISRW